MEHIVGKALWLASASLFIAGPVGSLGLASAGHTSAALVWLLAWLAMYAGGFLKILWRARRASGGVPPAPEDC